MRLLKISLKQMMWKFHRLKMPTDLNQDVVLDLDDIEDAAETTEDEIEKESEKAQLEAEEDMKETLKDMLPDDDEDDEDFEFIDLD